MATPRLLLADDSMTIRKVVELTFADEGIDVTSVADSDAAMQRFVEMQPDIVLVDVSLPGTTGYQICEMIKGDDATRHIPVMLLVGSFEPFDQAVAEAAGADGFLTKPFQSIRDLVARVKSLLGQNVHNHDDEQVIDEPAVAVDDGTATQEAVESSSEADDAEIPPTIPDHEPSGEEQVVEPAPEQPTSETSDIEDLYRSSFAETVKMEDLDTVDNDLGDSGLDDEMIEASYLSGQAHDDHHDELIKDFAWPAEPVVTESLYSPSDAVTEERPGFRDSIADLEAKPAASETEPTAAEPEATAMEHEPEEPETVPTPTIDPFAEEATDHPVEKTEEPASESLASEELIERIARQVIERLSDRAVREIAREAVPRIAEKLIREALVEENKT